MCVWASVYIVYCKAVRSLYLSHLQWIPKVDTLDTLSIAKNHPPLSHRFLKWRISNWENERLQQAQVL